LATADLAATVFFVVLFFVVMSLSRFSCLLRRCDLRVAVSI
jgi:hypothetical protein